LWNSLCAHTMCDISWILIKFQRGGSVCLFFQPHILLQRVEITVMSIYEECLKNKDSKTKCGAMITSQPSYLKDCISNIFAWNVEN
jgi:hypothetical protein